MTQALRSKLLFTLAAVIAILLGIIFLRHQLLGFVLTQILADKGLQVESMTVRDFGYERLRVMDLRLGPDGLMDVGRLDIDYRPLELLQGQLRRLDIDGLRLKLDLTGEQDPLAPFNVLLDREEDQAENRTHAGQKKTTKMPLPEVILTDGQLMLETSLGALLLVLSGEATPLSDGESAVTLSAVLDGDFLQGVSAVNAEVTVEGGLSGTASLTDTTLALPGAALAGIDGSAQFALADGRLEKIEGRLAATRLLLSVESLSTPEFRHASIDFDGGPDQANVTGQLESASGAFRANLVAGISDLLETPSYHIDIEGVAEHDSTIWAASDLPQPLSGQHQVRFAADGALPPRADWAKLEATSFLLSFLDGSRLTWSGQNLTYPDAIENLDGAVALLGEIADDRLSFTLAEDARLTADAVDASLEARLGLPDDLPPVVPAALAVTAFAEGARPFYFAVDLDAPDTRNFALALAMRAEGPWGGLVDLDGALTAALNNDMSLAQFDIADCKLVGQDLLIQSAGLFALQDAITLRVSNAELHQGPTAGEGLTGQAHVELPQATALIHASDSADANPMRALLEELGLDIALTGESWETAKLSATAALATLKLPDNEMTAANLRMTANSDSKLERIDADYSLQSLRHEGKPAAFTPLAFEGHLTRRSNDIDFALEGTWAGIPAMVTAEGRHDIDSGAGRLYAAFKPPAFAPDALQPAALLPATEFLKKVSGQAEASARLDWQPGDFGGLGMASLSEIGFDSAGIKLRGLNSAVSFTDLLSGRSLPQQLLTVDRIDPGLPITDLSVRFQLDPAEPIGLRLGKGDFSLLGARIAMSGNAPLDAGDLQDLTFSVRGLRLEKLFEAIDAEGFSGSGSLDGAIPVGLYTDSLVIRDARLAATAPGRLQIRSAQAKDLLKAGGEQAGLLLEALEDFHYEELSMTLANTANNDLDLTLSILGNNPDVLDGHPFQLNIDLESNIARLLDALLAGYKLSNETLQRLWELRP